MTSANTEGEKHRQRLAARMEAIADEMWATASRSRSVSIVSSPPGAGKTTTLLSICRHAMRARKRIGVACQTNAQADDVCRRLSTVIRPDQIYRFVGGGSESPPPFGDCQVVSSAKDIAGGPLVVVGTAMKWALIKSAPPIHMFLVDEAWQMAMATFVPLLRFCDRFILIGDPGQIPPVVSAPTQRWETSRNPPHLSAPEVLRARMDVNAVSLPATWRLPNDTARLVRGFYEFDFESASLPGERKLHFMTGKSGGNRLIDAALDRLMDHSIARVQVPMPTVGGLAQSDPEVATVAAETVKRALARDATATALDRRVTKKLEPGDIGVAASHRVMVQAVLSSLPEKLRVAVKVDTAERWQGLERELMVVVHPLSSMENPGEFDLETGRLCVMASRHQSGLIVIGRDHIGRTLDGILPSATQPLGRPDAVSRGLRQHREFWGHLDGSEAGR